jgi:hypothetical protein
LRGEGSLAAVAPHIPHWPKEYVVAILRRNVNFAYGIAKARDNKAYCYGGCWVADDVWRTTDCSGIVTHLLDALLNGVRMAWSRHDLCTESYRYAGGPGSEGPFGTIRVAKPGDIPHDAALRIGLLHGPQGGEDSHMTCTLGAEYNIAIESSSSYGQQVGGAARGYDHPMFHDWFYLPGPITDDEMKVSHYPVYPKQLILLRLGSTGHRVRELQEVLNRDYRPYSDLEVDSQYGPQTEALVREFQRRAGLTDDGVAGPATLVKLGLPTTTD